MKLLDVINAGGALDRLRSTECDFILACTLAKLAKAIEVEEVIYNAKRLSILKKYGAVEKGGRFELPQEVVKTVNDELTVILQTVVKIDFIPIDPTLLSGLKLSTETVLGLMPFFTETTHNPTKRKSKG